MKAAIIGGGVIGGGWASRFLLNGYDVRSMIQIRKPREN